MQKRLLVGLTVLFASTVAWFSSHAVILPPPTKTVTLAWDYPQTESNIVFNIYATTNLQMPVDQWPLLTNVTQMSCKLPIGPAAQFFVVSASNVVSGLESPFATR